MLKKKPIALTFLFLLMMLILLDIKRFCKGLPKFKPLAPGKAKGQHHDKTVAFDGAFYILPLQ